ncbi:hypothetical protein D3C72_2066890 [compost metagenome]
MLKSDACRLLMRSTRTRSAGRVPSRYCLPRFSGTSQFRKHLASVFFWGTLAGSGLPAQPANPTTAAVSQYACFFICPHLTEKR